MATAQSTMDYITDQLIRLGDIRTKKMFGEYAVYYDNKVVAFVCDDKFFLKPTEAGKKLLRTPVEAPPYPGAKMYYLLGEEIIDDPEHFCALVRATADVLPLPALKTAKRKK